MLEMTLIRMATLRPILPIDEILKKLEGLEKRRASLEPPEEMESSPSERPVSSKDSQKGKEVKEESRRLGEETRKEEGLERERPSKRVAEEVEPPSIKKMINPDDSKREPEGGGISQRVHEETWRGLVEFTRAKNPILGSFLALGNLVHIGDEKIEIGFEKDSFHYERILEKENRSQLESICHEYLKKKAKVIISALDQRMVSKGRVAFEAEEPPRNALEKQLTKGEEENPIVQEALRLFNGRIVEK
jgi:DNA polymerase-3 subunit gamma/tau